MTLVGASLKKTRRLVAEMAHGRIGDAALDDLLFALSEAVINAQQYGRPPATVKVWTAPERMVVHVQDAGAGPPNRLTGLVPEPEGSAGAGLGLWLSHQLADIDISLDVSADDGGFTVRLRAGRLPSREETAPDAIVLGAGTRYGSAPSRGTVHVIDGDGTSCCDSAGAGVLVRCDDLPWSEVPLDQRCPACQLLMDLWGSA
jgi:anti-sigma regulatory factor (Ser/Thr protein kinase)